MLASLSPRPLLLLLLLGVWSTRTTSANLIQRGTEGTNTNEAAGLEFLRQYDVTASYQCNRFMEASWAYNTNVTDHNRRAMVSRQLEWSEFHRNSYEQGRQFAWRGFSHAAVRRMFSYITVLGRAALPARELNEYADLLQQMKGHYATARVCRYDPQDGGLLQDLQDLDLDPELEDYDVDLVANRSCLPTLSLEPDLTRLMSRSRNPRELRFLWRAWRDAAGKPLRAQYVRFMKLANQAARLNGHADAGAYWRSEYEVGDLEADLEQLWGQLRPLYMQLHAYVRKRLREHYGEHLLPDTGPIPAHLLGNMWAQEWSGVLNLTLPYPTRAPYDVTAEMRRQNYTPVRMFRIADNFYRSLGLDPVPPSFWRDSMLSRPRDREVVCHASAWDMCNRQDYRVKMCTDVTMEDLIKAHHEMGHIQYDMMYRGQHFIFRDGANPGFHEAVGDVISLSAATPQHMRALGLLPASAFSDEQHRKETDINHLFAVAMTKIAFLPFALVLDKWRWRAFSGEIPPTSLNSEWWRLRMAYSGVAPPVTRTEEDFDAGAKYHVPANTPYVRYLVSFVLQFQLHEELCSASGHTGPLHTCSIYGSQRAGEMLRRGLSLGRSEPWPTALAQLTGGQYSRLDAGPIMRYFAPLHDWLKEHNEGQFIGWNPSEALVAGRLYANNGGTTAAYVLVALLILALMLLTGCLLARRWRKSKREDPPATPTSSVTGGR